jgi:hypothetical protein
MKILALLLGVLGVAALAGGAHAAPAPAPLKPFTATYQVARDGQDMGVATITLRRADDGSWVYRKDVSGTNGLAALLNASVHESSRLRWRDGMPEALSYDYQLQAIKRKQRHLQVDWTSNQVTVQDGKRNSSYPAQPGMVERNTLPLALGLALRQGKREVALPVAVRQTVERQQFKVTGTEAVDVPAGHFSALQVERTDADRGFTAWYAPQRYPLPVKLAQHDGGNLVMVLVSFKSP